MVEARLAREVPVGNSAGSQWSRQWVTCLNDGKSLRRRHRRLSEAWASCGNYHRDFISALHGDCFQTKATIGMAGTSAI